MADLLFLVVKNIIVKSCKNEKKKKKIKKKINQKGEVLISVYFLTYTNYMVLTGLDV